MRGYGIATPSLRGRALRSSPTSDGLVSGSLTASPDGRPRRDPIGAETSMPRPCPGACPPLPRSGGRLGLHLLLAAAASADEPAPIRFNTDFEGGSLGTVERLGEGAFRCRVKGQQDEHGRNRQASWYFFRMDGVRGRDLALTLVRLRGRVQRQAGCLPDGAGHRPGLQRGRRALAGRPRGDAGTTPRRRRRSGSGPSATRSGSPTSRPTRPGGWPACWSRSIGATTPGSRSSARPSGGGTCT